MQSILIILFASNMNIFISIILKVALYTISRGATFTQLLSTDLGPNKIQIWLIRIGYDSKSITG